MKAYKMIRQFLYIISVLLILISPVFAARTGIFPNADGCGTDTMAAYGASNDPVICIVNSTADTSGTPSSTSTRNGVDVLLGTAHQCIEGTWSTDGGTVGEYTWPANSGRIVIFETSGTIIHNGYMTVSDNYVSILGATAPSPGITFKGTTFVVQSAHDVYISHIRVRPGDGSGVAYDNRDAIQIESTNSDSYNVVIDHCSASWAIDENIQIYETGNDIYDVTISNTITSEALADSYHSKGVHSMGMIIGENTEDITIIDNLFASNIDRNPHLKSKTVQVVNNVIYNSLNNNIKAIPSTLNADFSMVGNYAKKGPNSGSGAGFGVWLKDGLEDQNAEVYVDDLVCYACSATYASACSPVTNGIDDDTSPTVYTGSEPASVDTSGFTIASALNLMDDTHADYLLSKVGARPNDRDGVDDCIIADVIASTGQYIDSQDDAGGCGPWPSLAENTTTHSDIPASPHADDDSDGYTNLEEWAQAFADALLPGILVSVVANDDTATEENTTTGQWTISCSPDCDGETINYSFSGSATLNTDYNCDDEDGTIDITGASATITLTPVDDAVQDINEIATLTITAGTGYTVGSPSSANIAIEDNDGVQKAGITVDASGSGNIVYDSTGSGSWSR